MATEPQPRSAHACGHDHDAPHDHGAVDEQLTRAEALCDRRGVKLTDLRRQVLALVLESGRPVGAYDLLDRLKAHRRGAAPPTVYRALDFLLEQGLVHRVERLAAFVACPLHEHAHAAQFLICGQCGAVEELEDDAPLAALRDAAARRGFTLSTATLEAEGRCRACVGAG